jgi:hypothetical protein
MAATASILGVIGGGSAALGALSVGATGLGIISSISGTMAQKGEARQAAYDESLAAKAARLKGEQEQNRIKKALLRDVSAATARAGQAGIGRTLLSQQTAGIESEGADELNTSKFNTDMEVRRRKAQAAIYRKAGRSSILDYVAPIAEGGGRLAMQAAYR